MFGAEKALTSFTMPDQKQRDHEKFTAEKIISLCGEAACFERLGDENRHEPDVLFLGQSKLGIEITMAFYQGDPDDPDLQAREDWKFARNPQFDENRIHRIIDPKTGRAKIWDRMVERLTASCQRALDEKCSKRYSGIARLWLGIYGNAPVTESSEWDEVVERVSIPEGNPRMGKRAFPKSSACPRPP
jgi:hypothetical protein